MATSITSIKLIVTGFLTVVPHGDSDGVTILLPDALLRTPTVELSSGKRCEVTLHVPLISQSKGTCQGDCINLNLANVPSSTPAGALAAVLGATPSNSARKLVWLPLHEELELGRVPWTPSGAHEQQQVFRLGEGSARVDPDCMGEAKSCPILGRFAIGQGALQTCQFAIDETDKAAAAGFEMGPFETAPSTSPSPMPLSEVQVIHIATHMNPPLELTVRSFYRNEPARIAKLFPDSKGEIAIVVASRPFVGHTAPAGECHNTGPIYAALHYELASGNWSPGTRVTPHYIRSVSKPHVPSSCSVTDLGLLTTLGVFEWPSSPLRCPFLSMLKD